MLFGSPSFSDGASRNIVVVGGGYAGVLAAKGLAKALKRYPVTVTLIEARDKFHHAIAAPRALVQPGFEKQSWIPYTSVANGLQNLTVKTNTRVMVIEKRSLVTESGDRIPFDYLVIATGSNNREPSKFPNAKSSTEVQAAFREAQAAVKSASSYLVVGGGAVGCEIAGELLTEFPGRPVTLVSGSPKLLPGDIISDKLRAAVRDRLEAMGAKIILGEKVDLSAFPAGAWGYPGRRTVTTDKGTVIESDLQFFASGNASFNGGPLAKSFPELVDPATGEVRTRNTFQVSADGFEHIFAVGDVSSATKYKTAVSANFESGVLVSNIVALVKAETSSGAKRDDTAARSSVLKAASSSLKSFAGPMKLMMVMLGRNGGRGEMFGFQVGDMMVKSMKSGDVMTATNWKTLGFDGPAVQ